AAEPIDHRHQIDEPSLQADVSDITTPDLVAVLNASSSEQVRIPLLCRAWQAGSRLGIDGFQTHQLQQPPHAFTFHWVALRLQPGRHLPRSVEWRPCVLLIEHAHQHQVLLAFWYRFVIVTRPCESQQFALLGNAQFCMLWLNQRSFRLNAVLLIFFPTSLPALSTG